MQSYPVARAPPCEPEKGRATVHAPALEETSGSVGRCESAPVHGVVRVETHRARVGCGAGLDVRRNTDCIRGLLRAARVKITHALAVRRSPWFPTARPEPDGVVGNCCCSSLPSADRRCGDAPTGSAVQSKVNRRSYGAITANLYSQELRDLIHWLLTTDPERRPSIDDILDIPWVRELSMDKARAERFRCE
eukprot:6132946-Pyramimonas_sp.AAC.2